MSKRPALSTLDRIAAFSSQKYLSLQLSYAGEYFREFLTDYFGSMGSYNRHSHGNPREYPSPISSTKKILQRLGQYDQPLRYMAREAQDALKEMADIRLILIDRKPDCPGLEDRMSKLGAEVAGIKGEGANYASKAYHALDRYLAAVCKSKKEPTQEQLKLF